MDSKKVNLDIKQVLYAFVFSWLITVILAITYRYPVPFYDYIGPYSQVGTKPLVETINAATLAFFFYGLLGGAFFIGFAIFVLNILVNLLKPRLSSKLLSLIVSFISALSFGVLMSRLDYLIGPW